MSFAIVTFDGPSEEEVDMLIDTLTENPQEFTLDSNTFEIDENPLSTDEIERHIIALLGESESEMADSESDMEEDVSESDMDEDESESQMDESESESDESESEEIFRVN